jgi:hypothetical protein
MNLVLQVKGDRYFGNPFIGDASEGARLATKEWLLKNVLYVAEQLATRKILTEEYEDDGWLNLPA